jgi:hypothetical protein
LAAFCFLGALGWQLLGLPFLNDVAPVRGQGKWAVRENWVLEASSVPAAAGQSAAASAGDREAAAAKTSTGNQEASAARPADDGEAEG